MCKNYGDFFFFKTGNQSLQQGDVYIYFFFSVKQNLSGERCMTENYLFISHLPIINFECLS